MKINVLQVLLLKLSLLSFKLFVYIRQASLVNRADLRHENFSSLTRDDFEIPKDKFTTNIYWICLSNLL